jgi:subtilisin family serine protease
LSLGFVSSIDLEADKDYLEGYYASGSTDPFTGGSGLFSYSWEDGGDWYSDQFSLRACLGSTSCSIGFRVRSNDSVGGSGVAIALIGLHGLDIDVHNHYLSENGTSMAAPHVAGVAALVRVRNPNYTYRDVISAILKGGDSAASGSELTYSYINSGKTLNAYGALKYIPQTEGVTVTAP